MRAPIVVVTLLLLAGLAPAERALVAGELGEKLDRIVQHSTGGGYWGVVLVAKDGKPLLAKGYGFADYASRPNTPDTLLEIASTSKQFTAAAILRLEMQKKLKLTDTLKDHLTDIPVDKADITIRQLLTHTSGISPRIGVPYASTIDRKAHVAEILGKPLVSAPGEKFAYCNAAYALLAGIVEVASGESFEAYVNREIFDRAGLTDTGFIRDADLDRARDTVRLSDGRPDGTAIEWNWGFGYRGMGGVVTTAYDMLAWDRALRGTRVLSTKAKRELYRPAKASYALGWRVATTSRGTTKVSHSGGVAGFVCDYVRFLEDDVVIVVLSNGKTNIKDVSRRLEEAMFQRPKITAMLDARPYELTEHRAIQIVGKTTAWVVEKGEGAVLLRLHDAAKKHDLATLRLPGGEARRVLATLKRWISEKRGPAANETEAGVYFSPYPGEPCVELSEDVAVDTMPRYTGRGENGEQIVDPRITLFVMDKTKRFWPVMVKMSDAMARKLAADLRKATRGR